MLKSWFSDFFAGELLVPIDEINDMSINDIRLTYGVSKKVAQIQLSYCK